MTFLSSIFGGGDTKPAGSTPTPAPIPATPTISSGQVESTDREAAARLARRTGSDGTILTKGLGDVGGSKQTAQLTKATALGGTAPLT